MNELQQIKYSQIRNKNAEGMERENRYSRDFTGDRDRDRRSIPREPSDPFAGARDANLRAASESSRGKRFSRVNSDLLQTALNHNFQLTKSHSSHNLFNNANTTNNINNTNSERISNLRVDTSRPHLKRWSSYNISQSKGDDAEQQKDSVSPLTVLKDEYNTRRPPITSNSSALFNTDNSFRSLVENESTTVNDGPLTSSPKSNKLYHKINQIINIAHNSMHSLVPMLTLKESENTPITRTSNSLNYQSESDDASDNDDDDDDDDDNVDDPSFHPDGAPLGTTVPDTQYRLESWKSPSLVDNLTLHVNDVNDIMQEINDFQSNFVDRYNNVESNEKLNRTQQKILDYKELYLDDEANTKNATSSPSFSTSYSYNLKIQNETILTQYTSIRLRFPTKVSTTTGRSLATTGVLGFLDRYKNIPSQLPKTKSGHINFEDKDDILNNIWETEINNFFHVKSNESSKILQ